jgi:tryptophan-rich sensory protein
MHVVPILYVLMGIALATVLSAGGDRKEVRFAAAVFGIQLALNAAWSLILFIQLRIDWALVEIVLLWRQFLHLFTASAIGKQTFQSRSNPLSHHYSNRLSSVFGNKGMS